MYANQNLQKNLQHEELGIDRFMDAFLAALVLRGKSEIWVRTDQAFREQECMNALHVFLSVKTNGSSSADMRWRRFIVDLRNACAPSNIGSFDGFRGLLASKLITITSMDLTTCWYYKIELSRVTAQSYFDRGGPRLRELAEGAAEAYLAPLKK